MIWRQRETAPVGGCFWATVGCLLSEEAASPSEGGLEAAAEGLVAGEEAAEGSLNWMEEGGRLGMGIWQFREGSGGSIGGRKKASLGS